MAASHGTSELRLDFLVRDVARLLRRRFEQSAQELGLPLTRAQSFVLIHVASEPGLSQSRLAHLMDVEPISLVRLIDRLEAETLVERRLDPRDRRVWRLYLTAQAAPILKRIRQISEAVAHRALTSVPPQESAGLLELLQLVRANLSATSPQLALEPSDLPVPAAR